MICSTTEHSNRLGRKVLTALHCPTSREATPLANSKGELSSPKMMMRRPDDNDRPWAAESRATPLPLGPFRLLKPDGVNERRLVPPPSHHRTAPSVGHAESRLRRGCQTGAIRPGGTAFCWRRTPVATDQSLLPGQSVGLVPRQRSRLYDDQSSAGNRR